MAEPWLLTHVNAARRRPPRLSLLMGGDYAMPTEVAVITAGIIFVFVVFAAVLAWGDYYSKDEQRAKKRS